MLISWFYVLSFTAAGLSIFYFLRKEFLNHQGLLDMKDKYPQFQALFELMKPTHRAQAFIILFLLRRALFAMVILFIKNSSQQVACLLFMSLAQLLYLITTKPYEDSKVNNLEIFNELVIMVCNYHLIIFTEPTVSAKLKYMAGWSLDITIMFQFALNCYIYLRETILIF